MSAPTEKGLSALLEERRTFPPSEEFRRQANAGDPAIYDRASAIPRRSGPTRPSSLDWFAPWQKVLEWNAPWVKWFVGGKLNVAYNCVDRHAHSARRNKAAIIWEGEPGDSRVLTYGMLEREVNRFANALQSLGVAKGDRVAIYMGMVPELAIAMLACAKIGAPHRSCSADFRRKRCASASTTPRPKWWSPPTAPGAAAPSCRSRPAWTKRSRDTPTIEKVVVVRRVGEAAQSCDAARPRRLVARGRSQAPPTNAPPSRWMPRTCSSSSTPAAPRASPRASCTPPAVIWSGVSTTHRYVFDIKEDDVYWCTADIGWVTGHSYIVYGPLANGATTLMYEGTPDFPDRGRFWAIIDKYGVNIFYTAPTAIRTFMRWGTEWPAKY